MYFLGPRMTPGIRSGGLATRFLYGWTGPYMGVTSQLFQGKKYQFYIQRCFINPATNNLEKAILWSKF